MHPKLDLAGEDFWLELLEGVDAIVWVADARTFDFDYVSPRAEAILGYPASCWYQAGFWEQHVHPDDRRAAVEYCSNAVDHRQDHRFEYRMIAEDGREVWLSDFVRVALDRKGRLLLRGVMVDITDIKRVTEALNASEEKRLELLIQERQTRAQLEAAQALSRSEALLRQAGHLARLGSWEVEISTGRIKGSDEFYQIVGLDPALADGSYEIFMDRIHREDRDRVEREIRRVRAEGGQFDLEFRIVRPDGQIRFVHSRATMSSGESGRSPLFWGILQDITDRKRLETQLQAQYEQLKELDTLKSRFIGAVSHELRTPLTSIQGYLEFLAEGIGGPLSDEQRSYLDQIQASHERLKRLVEELLDLARIEAGTFKVQLEDSDLSAKVAEIAESLKPQMRKAGVTFESAIDREAARAPMDPYRIGQVLLNLIGNAIKFSPDGGVIRLRAFVTDGGLRLEVRDRGPGIALEEMPRLFERFSQLEAGANKGVGTGLGLYISKAIVEAHGGRIGVESRAGDGSTFWIELPLPSSWPERP